MSFIRDLTITTTLLLHLTCLSMEKENENKPTEYDKELECLAHATIALTPEMRANIALRSQTILNGIPSDMIAYIAHFFLEPGNALLTLRNLYRFSRTNKRICKIIRQFLDQEKHLEKKARQDRANGLTLAGPWQSGN